MRLAPLLLALALPAGKVAAQTAAPALEAASAEARERWLQVCKASGPATREPLLAFQLEADVRNRSGVQSNDGHIEYRYLAPDCIRFTLPSKNETGRFGPNPEQYWTRSSSGVVVLAGREWKEDRRQVDDMLALARNYAALSNPARLNLLALEIPPVPSDLGAELTKRTRKLLWLALESPDFALVRGDPGAERAAVYRVELGLREEPGAGPGEPARAGLPAIAIVRAKDKPSVDPLLVEFSRYEERDGFRIPFVLLVHVLDRAQSPAAFAATPSQEVYVTSATLRPAFTLEDFQPKGP